MPTRARDDRDFLARQLTIDSLQCDTNSCVRAGGAIILKIEEEAVKEFNER